MAIQSQYVLSKDSNGDVRLVQNSIEVFKSTNALAIVNTLVLKEGNVGIGLASPTTKLHVQVANTINKQALLLEQLDTTNNPVCAEINNDGTNHGLYIHQDGVLAASKYGLYVYSNVAQVNSNLVEIWQENTASIYHTLYVLNKGTGNVARFSSLGVMAAGQAALWVYSNVAQVNSPLALFWQDHTSSTADVAEIDNNGTGHGLYLHQDGVLAASKYGLYVYSNAAQVNSLLVAVLQQNASSTKTVVEIDNFGTGQGFYLFQQGNGIAEEIDNNGTNHGLYIHQDGILAASKYGFVITSNAVQVNSSLVYWKIQNASTTAPLATLENDGTGHCLYIQQDGVLAASKYGLFVYSNTIQVNSELLKVYQDNASSTADVCLIFSDGTGSGLYIEQNGVLAGYKNALTVYSYAAQVNSDLVLLMLDDAGSTRAVLMLHNDGQGHDIWIQQDGNLATNNYILYIDNNGTPTDGAGKCIRLDGCSVANGAVATLITSLGPTGAQTTIQGWIPINIDGTTRYIPYW